MKKFLVMSALVGAFAFTSCASCDETQASEDFGVATATYAGALIGGDCAALTAAWSDYSAAYNNLCDSQKEGIDWAEIETDYNDAIQNLGC